MQRDGDRPARAGSRRGRGAGQARLFSRPQPPKPWRARRAIWARGRPLDSVDPRGSASDGTINGESRRQATTASSRPNAAEDDTLEASLRPKSSRRIRRPAAGARKSLGLHRRGEGARRGARPCAVLRPAGPGQDHAGADRGARTGREFPLDLRARCWPRRAISPPSSPISNRAMCCSSTKSTASIRRWRKSSIRRWRISNSIL